MLPVLVHLSLVSIADARQVPAPTGPAPSTAASPFRLVRSISGSRGEIKDGRYRVLDPRTSFRVPEDTTVIVYFEWLGPVGKHQFAGTWRGPANTSTTSTFEYVAKTSTLSAYWELTLPTTAPSGPWSLEATIDGFPAGVHAFEVSGMDAPVPVATPVRVPLTRQEVFARTLESAVTVEALDANGGRLAIGPGFAIDARAVATSFGLINNAVRLRLRGRSGPAVESTQVIAWNRRQGWVLVAVDGLGGLRPPARAAAAVQAGDPCYSVGTGQADTLTVASGEVVGTSDIAQLGAGLSVSFFTGGGAAGAPVLNEYGEAIGMLTDGALLQSGSLTLMRIGQISDVPSSFAVPIAALPSDTTAAPTSLATLAERGLFVPPVTHHRHILSGGFATSLLKKGAATQPLDQRVEFSRHDKTMTTFVTWSPVERIKGVTTLRLFDLDNRSLGETKPAKISLRPGDLTMNHWPMSVPTPGVYRVDVMLDAHIAWRGHFRVKD